MAQIDPIPDTACVERIAEPHQSTVAAIVRAAEMGLFTATQAQTMVDRIRAHLTALPITRPVVALPTGTLTPQDSSPSAARRPT